VSSAHRPRWIAITIAEAQLADLTGRPRDVLVGLIGNPRRDLVMAEDEQAYQMTTVVLAQPDGSLRLHVSVDNSGWAAGVVIVRTAHVPAGRPPPSVAG
jgi:hypothetical protein